VSQWGWVTFAYTVTLMSMGGYAAWSIARLRRVRRRLEEWR
jgi:hypothetical protein